MWRRTRMAVPVALAAAVLTGCGGDPNVGSIDTMGTNGEVGQMLLRNVYLEAPEGGIYEPGDTATLRLHLVNEADRGDRLLAVRSAADEVRIRWDEDCDGRFEAVDALPVLPTGLVPRSDAYFVELAGLDRIVRAGTSIPVTFEFEHSGTGRIDAMVEAREDGSVPEPLSCGRTASPTTPVDGKITVSGAVVAGVEPGCFLLDTGTTRYLLTDTDSPLVEPGRQLTVSGTAHPGSPTTCMEGVPLEVTEVHEPQ